jgi:hypothetical protein
VEGDGPTHKWSIVAISVGPTPEIQFKAHLQRGDDKGNTGLNDTPHMV